jgi:hypothetical protein
MEGMTHSSFGHYFVMSDDPHMQKRGSEELASFFQGNPSKLVSTELCDLLGANQLEYSGHESLEAVYRHQLYVRARCLHCKTFSSNLGFVPYRVLSLQRYTLLSKFLNTSSGQVPAPSANLWR